MKILLDTNIIIHREANKVVKDDIGILFNWLDRLKFEKCVHPITSEEIERNPNKETVKTMNIKLGNYNILKTVAPLNGQIEAIGKKFDLSINDKNDTQLLNEVYSDRVDFLITEDNKIHHKAKALGISNRVFRIDSFLEKVTAENPALVDYKVLSVKKEYFGNVDLKDTFFDSFREDYVGFDQWFNRKSDEIAYVCYNEGVLAAFLFIKLEREQESYLDITPTLDKKRRLKIGTLKVISNGFKIGERFLKIVFDNAVRYRVQEIYVTIFDKRPEQARLISLLEEFGFRYHGIKQTASGSEKVYKRNLWPEANRSNPKSTFPRLSKQANVFLIPIKPEYHTELLPDSKLNTESAVDFVENEPHRNAISKIYVSHSPTRLLAPGDIIVFYRTGGIYKGVATTIGIVENVVDGIPSFDELLQLCRKRTVLKPEELLGYWNRNPLSRPFVINFLYAFSFRRRITLREMLDEKILPNMDAVKTITQIEPANLSKLIKLAGV
ncbi:PIN domain-containing protein [Polluticoccus soli]|uniref:PIN domain-containing protein n=1 Tax=Polluticoccus soli TaxID=3034150 RepID=UPI0023E28D20|nr:PIN domain-containing protein [Flavipsychrobacter sp. JY13-12]